MSDEQFKRSVQEDARKAGLSEDMARYLADNVSPAAQPATVRNLCTMYGANSLVDLFIRAKTPAARVAALLNEATGQSRVISSAGIERVRLQVRGGTA